MKNLRNLTFISLALTLCQASFASGTANLRMNISLDVAHNYYLCLPNTGCLKIIKGKVYPIYESISLKHIFIMDASRGMQVTPQPFNASCNVKVKRNQTVTISGHLSNRPYPIIYPLYCSVSK